MFGVLPVPVVWEAYVETPTSVAESDVSSIAEKLKIKIPDDIQSILVDHSGEVTSPETVDLPNGGNTPFGPILVAANVTDEAVSTYSVSFAIKALMEWSRKSEFSELKMLPFASNTASGYFCLDYSNANANNANDPPVIFVDVGYDFGETGAVTPVADSLTDLLSKLK